MANDHVVVWDLDDTLGTFRSLEKHCDSNEELSVFVRPGLAAALERMQKAGFVHTVLTMASAVYAETALVGTGLRQYFARVESQGQRRKGDVEGIADVFGVPMAQAPARILFIGDRMPFDEPNHPDVLFHLEICATTRPGSEVERLLARLREDGRGSFREGFRALAASTDKPRRFWNRSAIAARKPVRRQLADLGSLLLFERTGACPVIGFEHPPDPPAASELHTFVPAALFPSNDSL